MRGLRTLDWQSTSTAIQASRPPETLWETPGYMAPEQASGDVNSVSCATDVYGLGAILYRLLTGRPPIHGDAGDLAQLIQLTRENDVISPRSLDRRIPIALETICNKCLETDPTRRYRDAAELADDLQRYFDGEPIQAKPLGWTRRLARWARHRPGLSATWCALAVFYLFHRVCIGLEWYRDPYFDFAATAITATAAMTAWFWQSCLIRTRSAAGVLSAWVTGDIVLLTLLLFVADSANSDLVILYHVIVAASVLRCRPALVVYVTCLAMAGYGVHLIYVNLATPSHVPAITTSLSMLLSLMLIGVIQYLSLRRSAVAYESQSAKGTNAIRLR